MAKLSERMLKKWRREALIEVYSLNITSEKILVLNQKIIHLTQELLDQYLMSKK